MLVAVLACVLLLLRGEADVGADGEVEPAANATPTADTASSSLASRPSTEPTATPSETARTELASSPQPFLKVRLSGLHPEAPWTASIRLDWEGRDEPAKTWLDHVDRQVPVDGLATFALPDWVRTATQPKIRLDARDPSYVEVNLRLDAIPSLDEELVVEVMVRAILTGRVEDTRSAPVASARIVAFAQVGAMPRDGALGVTNTRADGTFTLQVPYSIPLFVLAVPMQPMHLSGSSITLQGGAIADDNSFRHDLLPTGHAAEAALGKSRELPTFVLRDATRITGTVLREDGSAVGCRVASLPLGGITLDLSGEVCVQVLADGTIAPLARTTASVENGSFELPAALGVRTSIAVTGPDDSLSFGPLLTKDVVPPTHVEFVLPRDLVVRVLRNGSPVPSATVEIHLSAPAGRPIRLYTDTDGALRIRGSSPLRLRALHGSTVSPCVDTDPTVDREVVLDLAHAFTPVSIELEGSRRVRNATFRFVRRDGVELIEHGARDDRVGPFVCFVEPGSYVLHVERAVGERYGEMLLPQQVELEVGLAPVELRLRAQFGGRLSVVVLDARGVPVAGTCRVRGSDGREHEGRFFVPNARGQHFGVPGEILPGIRNTLELPLPAGNYTVLLDLGKFGTVTREQVISPLGNTDVIVRLP